MQNVYIPNSEGNTTGSRKITLHEQMQTVRT